MCKEYISGSLDGASSLFFKNISITHHCTHPSTGVLDVCFSLDYTGKLFNKDEMEDRKMQLGRIKSNEKSVRVTLGSMVEAEVANIL